MTVLVVGAAGTLGRACVESLVAAGYEVVGADRDQVELPGARSVALDVTESRAVDDLVAELENSGPITGLVYAAGLNVTGFVADTDWDQYSRLMAVNLQGAFHLGAALQRAARSNPRQFSCVFISSTAGLKGEAGGSVYVASKFGLVGFVQSYAAEVAQLGGRANVVCPGNVASPMLEKLAAEIAERQGNTGREILELMANETSFRRLIEPQEVAKTCSWLVSSESSGISGQTIVVNGPVA
ncbi:MAG: SDR family NAD(P)-dependent oxidoreductase [Aquiluna sp.]